MQFRLEYAHISEICALIPHKNGLAATATARVRQLILSSFDMRDCHLVMREPDKSNINYHVHPQDGIKNKRIKIIPLPIANALCVNRVNTDQTIIFR